MAMFPCGNNMYITLALHGDGSGGYFIRDMAVKADYVDPDTTYVRTSMCKNARFKVTQRRFCYYKLVDSNGFTGGLTLTPYRCGGNLSDRFVITAQTRTASTSIELGCKQNALGNVVLYEM